VRERLTFFIHRLGARIIAAMGKIRVEAEGDELQLLGRKEVTLQSHDDWVRITGKKGVLINGGGSYAKLWPEGIEEGTEDGWIVYAASHNFAPPRSMDVPNGKPAVCEECLEKAARQAAALKVRAGHEDKKGKAND
jgi:type VI secretion system secreted protein VgrG